MSTKIPGVGLSPYPELDAARKTLMARLDAPNSTRAAREKDYIAYLTALQATGIPVRRVASLDAMEAARAGGRRG